MANTKSAKARILVTERNRVRNNTMRASIRTALKGIRKAIDAKTDTSALTEQIKTAYSLIDRAILKGILHKNTGSRYKSGITLLVNRHSA
jgi:small subunit ribosomal protein S20